MKPQDQNNIGELDRAGHYVTVGDRKWKVIGDIQYEKP